MDVPGVRTAERHSWPPVRPLCPQGPGPWTLPSSTCRQSAFSRVPALRRLSLLVRVDGQAHSSPGAVPFGLGADACLSFRSGNQGREGEGLPKALLPQPRTLASVLGAAGPGSTGRHAPDGSARRQGRVQVHISL